MWKKDDIFDKFTLVTDNGEHEVRLRLRGWKNFLRFFVFKQKLRDFKSKPQMLMFLPLNRTAVQLLVDELRFLVDKKDEHMTKIEALRPVWENDKMTDKKELAGYIVVGKKKIKNDLINFIGIEDANGKRYYFKLLPTPYIKLLDAEGNPIPDTEASNKWTLATANTLDKILGMFPEALPDAESPSGNVNNKKQVKSTNQTQKTDDTTSSGLEEFDF
jgi:hypothetical protein